MTPAERLAEIRARLSGAMPWTDERYVGSLRVDVEALLAVADAALVYTHYASTYGSQMTQYGQLLDALEALGSKP